MTGLPRVACVGGWGSGASIWEPLARALPDAALEPLPWWHCLDPASEPLGRLLAASDPPAVLLGWSLGAVAVLRAALALGAGPAAPRLCLLSGSARMAADGEYPGADPKALRAMRMRLRRDPEGVLRAFASLCAAPEAAASDFEARYVHEALALPARALDDGLSFLTQADLRDGLERWAVPLMWIHGEADAVIPVASARYAAARSPGIRLEVLARRGHAVPWTAAEDVARLIRGLLHARRAH